MGSRKRGRSSLSANEVTVRYSNICKQGGLPSMRKQRTTTKKGQTKDNVMGLSGQIN